MAPRQAELFEEKLGARLVTAAVLAAVIVAAAIAGGVLWVGLVVAGGIGMAYELARLLERPPRARRRLWALTAPSVTLVVVATAAWGPQGALLALAFVVPLACGVAAITGGDALRCGAAVLYLAVPLASLVWLRLGPDQGLIWLLWLLVVVAATDSGAYLAGRTIGGPRLAPRLSPGKTWAGLLGGMLAAALAGLLFVQMVDGHRGAAALSTALLAAALAVVAQCGDLCESWLKRRSGYKDSGRLLPGHGGLLDRFDGLMLAAPVYAVMVAVLTSGGANG